MSGRERMHGPGRGWPSQKETGARGVKPSRAWWNAEDPGDPDFTIIYRVPAGAPIRIRPAWPYRMALLLARKRLGVTRVRDTSTGENVLTVNLGLTAVHRVAGTRLDRWLVRLVTVEVDRERACNGEGDVMFAGITPCSQNARNRSGKPRR